MQKFSYLKSTNADYIDELFARYIEDPTSVDESWRYFFEGLELAADGSSEMSGLNGTTNSKLSANLTSQSPSRSTVETGLDLGAEAKVAELILTYRTQGRLLADIDPLHSPSSSNPMLELSAFGLTIGDLGKTFHAGKFLGMGQAKLSEIIAALKDTYCRTIGVETAHIQDPTSRDWLRQRMESTRNRDTLDSETRKQILKRLTESENFERFLHTRYVAQKRFSIEGGESTIVALDCMIELGAELGATDMVFGMAHRGRLNVLNLIFGKKPEYIFTEFEGNYRVDPNEGEGDVKYHKGYSRDFTTRKGKSVHLSLAFNPSHLEFVNSVVEGMARAKQDIKLDHEQGKVFPILIHGDAAFAGQGVCYETVNMSQLQGYKTGGTLHIIINNQVGFTTDPADSRSTQYCTDLARMLDSPIFHVNADDPEAVWWVAKLAIEYRQKFKSDVFIDLICYRKHGHNEGDEPSFTQPLLYKTIKAHASTRELYAQKLANEGAVSAEQSQALIDENTAILSIAQTEAKSGKHQPHTSMFEGQWKGLKSPTEADLFSPIKTGLEESVLKNLSNKLNAIPSDFHLHPKLNRFFEGRAKAVTDGKGIDWGNAEALAYGTLLLEGHPVRLSGQDAERGTFTHRHSVLTDTESGEKYTPLNHLSDKQAHYQVYNSHLSEAAVMGFEYGYALAAPHTLTIWEAQFGDFANGAQVIIDQFITTSESKWHRMNGLVLLLPHGYEGQGPEHSSARLERFLQLCGRGNITVCNLSTPAQIFHAIRRQLKRDFRKPLVVMSPKSLLRLPAAVSTLAELSQGTFQEIIDDGDFSSDASTKSVKRVLLCSGKVYYDIVADRTARKRNDVAVVRIEQFYPWPAAKLSALLRRYPNAKDYVWVQEEPRNMGGWSFIFGMWSGGLDEFQTQVDGKPIRYAGRDVGASPAVGSPKVHEAQQKAFLEKAFGE